MIDNRTRFIEILLAARVEYERVILDWGEESGSDILYSNHMDSGLCDYLSKNSVSFSDIHSLYIDFCTYHNNDALKNMGFYFIPPSVYINLDGTIKSHYGIKCALNKRIELIDELLFFIWDESNCYG